MATLPGKMSNDVTKGSNIDRKSSRYFEFLPTTFIATGLFIYFLRNAGLGFQLLGGVMVIVGCIFSYEMQTEEAKKQLIHLCVKVGIVGSFGGIAYGAILVAKGTLQQRVCSWHDYIIAFLLFALAGLIIPGLLMVLSFTSKDLEKI